MELRDLLELGAKKAGSLTALGKILDVSQPNMSHAKAHKARLPADAVVRLSDYLGIELRIVMAANELATEKKEEKRRFWSPFVEHARAATFAIAVTSACVTSFVSPTPAEAAPLKADAPARFILCKIKNGHAAVGKDDQFKSSFFRIGKRKTSMPSSRNPS